MPGSPTDAAAPAADPMAAERAAKVAKWERWTQPLIIVAAILPLVGNVGHESVDLRSWGVEMACWLVFLVDLLVHVRLRRGYLRTRFGIIDFWIVVLTFPWSIFVGSSAARLFALFRLARVARIVAVANHSRFVRRTVDRLGRPFLYIVVATMLCSFIVWKSEHGHHGFSTYGDALWWGVVTVTTVGYGDLVPTSTVGQVTATVLMFIGVALLGTVAATLASLFRLQDTSDTARDGSSTDPVDAAASDDATELRSLRAEIADLRSLVERLVPAERTGGGDGDAGGDAPGDDQTPTSQS